jgi:hypothetical protein
VSPLCPKPCAFRTLALTELPSATEPLIHLPHAPLLRQALNSQGAKVKRLIADRCQFLVLRGIAPRLHLLQAVEGVDGHASPGGWSGDRLCFASTGEEAAPERLYQDPIAVDIGLVGGGVGHIDSGGLELPRHQEPRQRAPQDSMYRVLSWCPPLVVELSWRESDGWLSMPAWEGCQWKNGAVGTPYRLA